MCVSSTFRNNETEREGSMKDYADRMEGGTSLKKTQSPYPSSLSED